MPNRNDLFPSKWLRASDILQPTIAQIDYCRQEPIGEEKTRKPVIHWRHEQLKPWILGPMNYDVIVGITGEDDIDDWNGHRLELYVVDTTGPKGPTKGIRARPVPSRPPAKRAAPPRPVDPDTPMPDAAVTPPDSDSNDIPF